MMEKLASLHFIYSTLKAIFFIIMVCVLVGCITTNSRISVIQHPTINSSTGCSNRFIEHELPHITTTRSIPPEFFDSNGAGVALADLDNNGLIDIVLAGLSTPVTILWNQGKMQFIKSSLSIERTRSINIVDFDSDGRLDLVFTHVNGLPSVWKGVTDTRSFTRIRDSDTGLWFPVYAMAWGDIDQDNDLDMIGASYDVELGRSHDGLVIGGGVFIFENQNGKMKFLRLADTAQSLAIALTDLNRDGIDEILIGNDFALRDYVFLKKGEVWEETSKFINTSQNTMSFALGDINNDGVLEIFSADMKPYEENQDVISAWSPVRQKTDKYKSQDGIQIEENVLQSMSLVENLESIGQYINIAEDAGVTSTGWTWSAEFGDLDQDGFIDLYTVNGMIAKEMFSHLAMAELVEKNQVLRNNGSGKFEAMQTWHLDAVESGRGMSMADLDNDGDLDIVVNNLITVSKLYENKLCGGSSLQVNLEWQGVKNFQAIGSTLELITFEGKMRRDVRISSGYLSGSPAQVHFGFNSNTPLERLIIYWPDGVKSVLEKPEANIILTVKRQGFLDN